MNCPPVESLAAVLSGTVTDEDLPTLDAHLQSCSACRQTLDELSDAPRLNAWLASDPAPTLRPEAGLGRIGRYRLEAPVGRGGMGVVFRARDDQLHRTVAVKVLRAERAGAIDLARFAREARSAAGLRHDHLVPVLGIEESSDGSLAIVMPLVRGPSLKDRLRTDPGPTPRESAGLIRQVADGLAAVHAAGMVHRDVKPGNVLLDADDGRAKLTDFGLARTLDPADALTRESLITGTPEYMSPEQAARPDRADPRSDVYSLGVMLYECLTGVAPFRGTPLEVLARHKSEEPISPDRLNPQVPADLVTICLKCVAKDPAKRYANAAAARDDLDRFLAGRPIFARPVGRAERAWRRAKRNPLPVAVVVVSVIGFTASAAGWWRAGVKAHEAEVSAGFARDREADAAAAQSFAEEKAALAEERSRLALSAITTLVTKAQNLIGDTPGTLKLKQQLNETALADLRKLTEATAKVPGADRTTLLAHLKLGDTFQLLGQTDDARKEWNRAADLAEELLTRDPDDVPSRRDLARAHYNLGFVANRMTDYPNAERHMGRAVRELEDARRRKPDDVFVLDNLAIAYAGRADVSWLTQQTAAALDDFGRSVSLHKEILTRDPDNSAARSKLLYATGRIGYVQIGLLHDYEAAEAIFREQVRVASDQLAKTPTDRTWQRNYHISLLDLSSALQRQCDFPGAEKAAREALAGLEPAAAAEPDNVQVQRDFSSGLTHLGLAQIVAGRFAEAEAAFTRSLDVLTPFAARGGAASYVAFDLPPLCYNLAVTTWRQGRYADAAKWIERMGEDARKLTGTSPDQTQAVLGKIRSIQTAFALSAKAVDDPAFAYAQAADVAPQLAALRALVLARRGDDDAARKELARLDERFPDANIRRVCRAFLDGLAAARSTDPSEKNRYVESGSAALIEAVRNDRSLLDSLHLFPELVPIRTNPAYRTALQEMVRKPIR